MTAISEAEGGAGGSLADLRLYSVSPYSDLTGAPISSVNHARLLYSRFRSVCLVLPGPGPIEDRAHQADLPVLFLPIQNRGLRSGLFRRSLFRDVRMVVGSRWRYYQALCAELRREPGLVHIHSRASIAPLALVAARRCGVPSILHFRETAPSSWLDSLWVHLLSKGATAVVCVSDGIRREYGKSIRQRAQVIHNFMDSPSLPPQVENEVPHILMAAKMGHRKGVDVFLEVCRLLHDEKILFKASMVGGWNSKNDQQAAADFIQAHQLESVVKDCGVVADMAPVYARADILLLPARQDPLPRVIMEAMSHGIPVVVTRVDGIPEMVEDGVTGFLAESEDAVALASRSKQLLEEKFLRRQMGQAGRERARELFSPEVYTSKILTLYKGLLSRDNSKQNGKGYS